MKELQERLLKVQQELKAPKGQFNKFGNYKYRSCEDILEAVKPINGKHGLLLTITDDVIAVGNRIYIKATATIRYEEETLSVSAMAREEETKKGMDASQITGSASSYARKYALNGLYCIDDTKDADATNTHGATPMDKVNKAIADKVARMQDGELKEALKEIWSATSVEALASIFKAHKTIQKDSEFIDCLGLKKGVVSNG